MLLSPGFLCLPIRWAALSATVGAALSAAPAQALETPIGAPQQQAGMQIGAVYLQPVDMAPGSPMRRAAESDMHLEADVHALARNPHGYAEGAWVPFLHIRYELRKLTGPGAGGAPVAGHLMPMAASDGPHYGDNVKLPGPGRYRVTYTVYPPDAAENPMGRHYGRHIDRATGVQPWFKPFDVAWEFTFAGAGKKGGY